MTRAEELRNRIMADERNLQLVGSSVTPNSATHAAIIADCAMRFIEADDLGIEDVLLKRTARLNLRAALRGWRA